MMRLTSPLPDFTNLNHLPDWFMGWLFGKGMDFLRKNYKIILKPKNFRKKLGWFQIICLGLLGLSMAVLCRMFTKIHLKFIGRLLFRGIIDIVIVGFGIFKKIEPEKALELTKKLDDELIKDKMDKKTLIDALKKI
jgi:hypothetical protein